jgi:hypothetical protein
VALDQLDGQARFTDTTTADNYQLVLSQELVCSAANVSYTEQAKAKIGSKREKKLGERRKITRSKRFLDWEYIPWLLKPL